ncbi:unnamed protein product [Periconia digitata]|uniref:Uncharacterized protein n=1 Tax=Periconia digitata TaxID=1303443 RepID=A0A9W4U9B7_9PLEO|nr:unnamed protein product [Periconia digitata]
MPELNHAEICSCRLMECLTSRSGIDQGLHRTFAIFATPDTDNTCADLGYAAAPRDKARRSHL